jgi:hypothetical protein
LNELQIFKKSVLVLFLVGATGCTFWGSDRLLVVEVNGASGLPVPFAEVFLDETYAGKTGEKGILRIKKPKKLLGEQALLTVTKSNAYVEYVPYEDKVLLSRSRRQFVSLDLAVRGGVSNQSQIMANTISKTNSTQAEEKKPQEKLTATTESEPKPKKTKSPNQKSHARQKMIENQLHFAREAASRATDAKNQSEKIMHANNAFHAAEDALNAAKKLEGPAYVKALRSYRQTMDALYKSIDHEPFRQKRDRADKILLSH